MTDLKKKIEEAAKSISLEKYPVVMVDAGAGGLQTDINYPRRVHHERTFIAGAEFALSEAAQVLARIEWYEKTLDEVKNDFATKREQDEDVIFKQASRIAELESELQSQSLSYNALDDVNIRLNLKVKLLELKLAKAVEQRNSNCWDLFCKHNKIETNKTQYDWLNKIHDAELNSITLETLGEK